jgi:hypothetical protein
MAMLDVASNKIHAETMTMFGPRWANLNEFHSNWNFDHFEGSAKGKIPRKIPVGIALCRIQGSKNHEIMERQMAEDMGMDFHGKKTWFGQQKASKISILYSRDAVCITYVDYCRCKCRSERKSIAGAEQGRYSAFQKIERKL